VPANQAGKPGRTEMKGAYRTFLGIIVRIFGKNARAASPFAAAWIGELKSWASEAHSESLGAGAGLAAPCAERHGWRCLHPSRAVFVHRPIDILSVGGDSVL
jgi:hypothetical protein